MAACGRRAAARENAPHWRAHAIRCDRSASAIRNAAFLQGLQQLGWTVGQNVQIDYRWSGGNKDDTHRFAAELVALAPDLIFAPGSGVMGPLQQATCSVPIVFVLVVDPVGSGFVNSLARPGGNATGFTSYDYGIGAKWLEVLKEIAPSVTRAAVIRDPAIAAGLGMWAAIQSVSPSAAIEVSPVNMTDAGEIERRIRPARLGGGQAAVHRRFRRSPSTRPWTIFRCNAMPRRSSTKSTFGAAVSSLLTERRMSQADLAEAVGKSRAYTNQTLTARKSASPEWVNLVAETLRLSRKQRATLHRAAAKDQGYEIDLGEYRPKKR